MRPTRGPGRPRLRARTERPVPLLALRASRRARPRTAPLRSQRARHPIVVIGNAVLTIIVLVALVGGIAIAIGKQRFEAAGPLERERIVNIPRGLGIKDIAELLQREGVIDQPWVFMGGVVALKARDELK